MALEHSMEAPRGGTKKKAKKVPAHQLTEEQARAQEEELRRTGGKADARA